MTTPTLRTKAQTTSSPAPRGDQPIIRSGLTFSNRSGSDGQDPQADLTVRRLIILVSDQDMDETEMARRIWELASPAGLELLFLGLCRSIDQEAQVRRRLVTLSALSRDPRIRVETKLEFGRDWDRKVQVILRTGDVLICQKIQRTGFGRKPLSQAISRLGFPVWTLDGFSPHTNTSPTRPLAEAIFWLVSIAIMIGFFFIQVKIMRLPNDWVHNAMLYLAVVIEIGLLWLWHNVSS